MPIIPKSQLQFGSELSYFNSLLKNYTGQNMGVDTAILLYNRIISTLYTEIGNSTSEDYKESFSIPATKAFTHQTAVDTNWTYSLAYRILTLNKEAAVWTGDKDKKFDNEWIGAPITLVVDPGGDDSYYNTTIEAIYNAELNQIVLTAIDPAIPHINPGTQLQVIINSTSSLNLVSTIDLTEFTEYDYIDNVLAVSSTAAPCTKLEVEAFNNLTKSALYLFSSYKDSVIWTRETNKIIFGKGNLANYGNRTIHYKRKFVPLVNEASFIDLPMEYHNVMTARAVRRAFQHMDKPIPQLLMKDDIDFTASKAANEKERIKQLEKDTLNTK